MSTHSDSEKPYAEASTSQPSPGAHSTLSAADIEMDARIAAYIASSDALIAQAEALLIRSRAVFDESGLDEKTIMSKLSPAELEALNEMTAQDEADEQATLAEANAAQAFAAPARKDAAFGGTPVRRSQSFI